MFLLKWVGLAFKIKQISEYFSYHRLIHPCICISRTTQTSSTIRTGWSITTSFLEYLRASLATRSWNREAVYIHPNLQSFEEPFQLSDNRDFWGECYSNVFVTFWVAGTRKVGTLTFLPCSNKGKALDAREIK